MKFGKLELNPAENPGVLDTATWDLPGACGQLSQGACDWPTLAYELREGRVPIESGTIRLWAGSVAVTQHAVWFLAGLQDGQSAFLRIRHGEHETALGAPVTEQELPTGEWLGIYPADAVTLDRYCRRLHPSKGPRALGATPRLGIGTRMTTQVWPGIFTAMARRDIAANSIQNSIRELSLLEDLLSAKPPETNYSTGIGQIQAGWTGSTYEGLWVAGVLAALQSDFELRYGADADHIQVKRGTAGVERAKRVIRSARYYSFYTLDMADVLDYEALQARPEQAEAFLERKIGDAGLRRQILDYHVQPCTVAGRVYQLDTSAVGRFVGKYWEALGIVEELAVYITSLKEDSTAFDLELTIDEHPPEVSAFDCLTTNEEVLFLAREIKRRALAITHLAPNFGQEKGHDYRGVDGLAGLERRVRDQYAIATQFGLMLDIHSGDDLSRETRRVFGRATAGRVHFKVSPMLQLIYAEVLQELQPALFERWWLDAVAYARREADNGSPVARECLRDLDSSGAKPSPRHKVFHYYSFPFVGRRDDQGQFLHRADFYRLPPEFVEAYRKRIDQWLGDLTDDVFPKNKT